MDSRSSCLAYRRRAALASLPLSVLSPGHRLWVCDSSLVVCHGSRPRVLELAAHPTPLGGTRVYDTLPRLRNLRRSPSCVACSGVCVTIIRGAGRHARSHCAFLCPRPFPTNFFVALFFFFFPGWPDPIYRNKYRLCIYVDDCVTGIRR